MHMMEHGHSIGLQTNNASHNDDDIICYLKLNFTLLMDFFKIGALNHHRLEFLPKNHTKL